MKLTPKTILLSLLWLAASCASNPAYAASDLSTTLPVKDRAPVGTDANFRWLALTYQQPKEFPVALDIVIPFRDPKLIPATHLTVWRRDLLGKLGAEWWAPVVALDDAKLSFGSAAVLSYSTGGMSAYLGLVGQVQFGEIPHSGFVFGGKATLRF